MGSKMVDYKTCLAEEIVDYLNSFAAASETPRRFTPRHEPEVVLKFWKRASSILPNQNVWSEERYYLGSLIFNPTCWLVIYSKWKSGLHLKRLPYFNQYGTPVDTCKVSRMSKYVHRMLADGNYPDLSDLYQFSRLVKDVWRLRSFEVLFQNDGMSYCPCIAKTCMGHLSHGRIRMHTLDAEDRAVWIRQITESWTTPPKCPIHAEYMQPGSADDAAVTTTRVQKATRRQRSRSAAADYCRRSRLPIDALMHPLYAEELLGRRLRANTAGRQ